MNVLEQSLLTIFKPNEAFLRIKERDKRFDYLSPLIVLLIFFFTRVFEIYFTHYPLASIEPRQTSVLRELVKTVIPVITWIIACYSITTISEGETLIREQFSATIYCLLPYIIITIPVVLLSHLLSANDSGLFNFLHMIKWLWMGLLIFYSTKIMNNYSVSRTILICFLSVIAAIVIWLLIGLFYILTSQVITFVDEFIKELQLLQNQ
jgi:hypothetical protein